MKITAQIDSDYKCLRGYFEKLFSFLEESKEEEKFAPLEVVDRNTDKCMKTFHHISHFIKPDMVISIYSFLDFWLLKVCEYQKIINSLPLGSKDIKGKNDLNAYHKYLTKYAGLDLNIASDSYKRLHDLRRVRNKHIHGGGHIKNEEETDFSNIEGINVSVTLVFIEDSFIWNTLEHANTYLQAAAQLTAPNNKNI